MNDPRGSIWRRWDLHVHTPESYHQQFGDDWDAFVEKLRTKGVEHDIEVAIINDYFSVDGYAKLVNDYCDEKGLTPSLKLSNGKNLYILPGIELRLSIYDHDQDAINIHVVFDPTILPDTIRSSFIERLKVKYGHRELYCKKEDLIKIGNAVEHDGRFDENLDLRNISEADKKRFVKKAYSLITLNVDDLDNGLKRLEESLALFDSKVYLKIIANKGHGSLAGFDWYNVHKQEGRAGNNRRSLLSISDICFSNSQDDRAFLLGDSPGTPINEILDRFRTLKPCVWGSDAHSIDSLFHPSNGNSLDYTWIKADPTFEGLRQILFEPIGRVYIGITPEKILCIDNSKHLYADLIEVKTNHNDAEWFDSAGIVPLNPGLISIIGNKGAGKSALADMIASAGNCENDSYSFLSMDRFLKLDQNKKYIASIKYLDGTSDDNMFSKAEYDQSKPAKVVYLSQSFVRDLCESEDISRLQLEIYRVLGSHIPEEERGQSDNLDDIIKRRTGIYDKLIVELETKLNNLNDDIVKYESYEKPSYRKNKYDKLVERQKELKDLQDKFTKIPVVAEPQKEENKTIANEVSKIRGDIESINKLLNVVQDKLNLTVEEIEQLNGLIAEINISEMRNTEFKNGLMNNPILKKYKIDPSKLLSFTSDTSSLKHLIDKLNGDVSALRKQKEDYEKQIVDKSKLIKERESLLSAKERKYQDYQSSKNQFNAREKEIIGDKNTPNSIQQLQAWIEFIDNRLKSELDNRYDKRKSLVKQIVNAFQEKKGVLLSLFSYGQEQAKEIAIGAKLPESEILSFGINLRFKNDFDDQFLSMISQNKIGTFYSNDGGIKELKKIKNKVNFNDMSTVYEFPNNLLTALKNDLRKEDPERDLAPIEEQLIEGINLDTLYDFIFGYQYLEIAVDIIHKDRILENLSPGEKGTVLLIFYLLLDKDRRPLIIDQPEENLDNETIYKVLVPLVKKSKEQRQIIIVTHNPNLAVVCDSEQIIHATMDKENRNQVSYETGSIEKSSIREDTINILEGTKHAFANRQGKYHITNN